MRDQSPRSRGSTEGCRKRILITPAGATLSDQRVEIVGTMLVVVGTETESLGSICQRGLSRYTVGVECYLPLSFLVPQHLTGINSSLLRDFLTLPVARTGNVRSPR